jgi:hypothetical protein
LRSSHSWVGVALWANLIAFIFVESLLAGMVLDDSRSLYLGNWDAGALGIFVALTFVIIPIGFFAILVPVNIIAKSYFELFVLFVISALFAIQMDHFYIKDLLISFVFVRAALILVAAGIFLFVLYRLRDHLYSFAKFAPVLSLLLAAVFSYFTMEAIQTPRAVPPDNVASQGEPAKVPVFLISMERVVHDHVFQPDRRIDASKFPNLARLVSVSNNYHRAYASATNSALSLQQLYSGHWHPIIKRAISGGDTRALEANPPILRKLARGFQKVVKAAGANEESPPIADIFHSLGRRAIWISDIDSARCDKTIHICLNAIGENTLQRRLSIIKGWYRKYLKVFVPVAVDEVLWRGQPAMNDLEKFGGGSGDNVGKLEMDQLINEIGKNPGALNLYVTHNLTHHDVQAISLATAASPAAYARQVEGARAEMITVERQLARLFRVLDRHKLFEKSLIVFTADTGNDPGMDTWLRKGPKEVANTPEIANIILSIKQPGQTLRKDFDAPVSHVDVLPTILNILGVKFKHLALDGRVITDIDNVKTAPNRPIYFTTITPHIYKLNQSTNIWVRIN